MPIGDPTVGTAELEAIRQWILAGAPATGSVPEVQSLLGLEAPPWRLAGPGAILLVHAYSMYVYFYLFTRAGLSRLDAALLEAAASLGAGKVRTLFRVTLPLLRPALAGAALLTFMTSLASFSAPYLFGGSFRVYDNKGSFALTHDDYRAFVEAGCGAGYVVHLGYRMVDYDEDEFDFDDYDADIAELAIGYRW